MADPTLVVRVAATLDVLKANLADGTNQIETTKNALLKMASSYDGSKIIAQAGATFQAIQQIGGVTKLTADEQAKANAILDQAIAKYQALGMTVPPQMQAVADATKQADDSTQGFSLSMLAGIPLIGSFIAGLSVERVLAFADATVTATARFADLSLATGISTDGLQRLQYVGQGFGLDIDQLSRGVEQLSAKLANGDANATKAVEMLGLSVSDLLAMGPQEAFLTIADAAGRIQDPMTKSGVATDLWGGKLAKVLVPALGDLRTAMNNVPQTAIVSDANIQKAHDFDVALAHLGTTMKATLMSWLTLSNQNAGTTPGGQAAAGAQPPSPSSGSDIPIPSPAADQLSDAKVWSNMLDELRTKQAALSTVNVDAIATDAALGVSVKDLADHYHLSEAAVTSLIDAHKKFEAAVIEVNTAGQGWQGTLDSISGDTVAAITYDLQAGVAQNTLATYYGLTSVQVKAVASSLTEHTAAMKLDADQTLELDKLQNDYYDTLVSRSGTTSEIATANINKFYQNLWDSLDKTGKLSDDVATQLTANWSQALNGVGVDWAALRTNSINSLQDTFNTAQRTLDAMTTDGLVHSQAEVQHFRDIRDAALDAYRNAGAAATTSAQIQKAAIATITKEFGGDLVQMGNQTVSLFDSMDQAQQAFADGLDASTIKVKDLAGEVVSLADAQKQFDAGNSITYDLSTPEGLANYKSLNPAASFTWDDSKIEAFAANGGTLQQLLQMGVINPYAGYAPGRAVGGPVQAGQTYTVGERGPETLVMGNASGAIIPNGGVAGGTVVISPGAIVFNYPFLKDARTGAMIGEIIMNKLKSIGTRF